VESFRLCEYNVVVCRVQSAFETRKNNADGILELVSVSLKTERDLVTTKYLVGELSDVIRYMAKAFKQQPLPRKLDACVVKLSRESITRFGCFRVYDLRRSISIELVGSKILVQPSEIRIGFEYLSICLR